MTSTAKLVDNNFFLFMVKQLFINMNDSRVSINESHEKRMVIYTWCRRMIIKQTIPFLHNSAITISNIGYGELKWYYSFYLLPFIVSPYARCSLSLILFSNLLVMMFQIHFRREDRLSCGHIGAHSSIYMHDLVHIRSKSCKLALKGHLHPTK